MPNLLALPDISNWNTKNVTDISNIFYNCSNLSSLPDISKWDIQNVTKMASIFDECTSLKSLPDISNGIQKMLQICEVYFMIVSLY